MLHCDTIIPLTPPSPIPCVYYTVGAPPAQVDPAAVSTGDRVRVELEPELFQAMQEGRGVWNDLMLNVSTEKVGKL